MDELQVPKWAIAGIAILAIGAIVAFFSVGLETVEGSERVVWQSWSGVHEETDGDGTHPYFALTTTPHVYYIGTDTFIADDKTVNPDNDYMDNDELQYNQPDMKPIVVPVQMEKLSAADREEGKTTGPTPIEFRLAVQYHLDPGKLVALHKNKTKAYRTTFLKDVVREAIIRQATVLDARTVYLGEGRVKLQNDIENALKKDERFQKYGIVVEKFVLTEVTIQDKSFADAITKEARAEQDRKTAIKQEQALLAKAKAAEAEATAEQKRRLVEAETQKREEIAKAEAQNEKKVLEAQAEAEKVRLAAAADAEKLKLEGQGLRDRKVLEAEGVLALGKAEAEAKRLQLEAYQGDGGARFAEVEKAKALGAGIEKVYYIPESMSINAIASDFQEAVQVALPAETAE